MAYRAVRGVFDLVYQGDDRRVGSRPDGDSVWFLPDDADLLSDVGGRDAEFNGGQFAQLRFEGIDALELHYPGSRHQNRDLATAARDFMLAQLGFGTVDYAPNDDLASYVRSSVPEQIRGFILTRAIDPFGRPVSFVFVGDPPAHQNNEIHLEVPLLNRSVNAGLMRSGNAYPAYYTARNGHGGLPIDLRDRLTDLAVEAWYAGDGLWPQDQSRDNPRIRDFAELEQLAIWPKLYRRIAAYFSEGNVGLAGFDGWLRESDKDDEVIVVPTGELANLHDTYDLANDRISMRFWPEELMVVPG